MEMEMEMDADRIGMVLVRASELHSKIATCIHKSTLAPLNDNNDVNNDVNNGEFYGEKSSEDDGDKDCDGDVLLSICDAFDSLESHLSSLQALQQQQQYEREAVVRDIEYNRKMLLKKLSEYTGEHLDVIREAEAFASMKVEHDNELFPPYSSLPPNSLGLDNSLRFASARKLVQNGHDSHDGSKKIETQNMSGKIWGGLRFLVSSTAKTMLTIVGVISLLSLAGYEPRLKKKVNDFPALSLFDSDKKTPSTRCPPGKVAVMENGEIHCIVKERVEIPFNSVALDPDVNYGCG